jgi:hypothetical protein
MAESYIMQIEVQYWVRVGPGSGLRRVLSRPKFLGYRFPFLRLAAREVILVYIREE